MHLLLLLLLSLLILLIIIIIYKHFLYTIKDCRACVSVNGTVVGSFYFEKKKRKKKRTGSDDITAASDTNAENKAENNKTGGMCVCLRYGIRQNSKEEDAYQSSSLDFWHRC